MKDLKIKLICGFRKDQHYTIGADEAHKAYYLFLHPNERGIFSTGLALTGMQIQAIEPDYNATMGWNPMHTLGEDDYADLESKGIDKKIRDTMSRAKDVAVSVSSVDQLPKELLLLE